MNDNVCTSDLVMHRKPYPIELSDGTEIPCSLIIVRRTRSHQWGVDRTWSIQLESTNGRVILEETDLPQEAIDFFNQYMPRIGAERLTSADLTAETLKASGGANV